MCEERGNAADAWAVLQSTAAMLDERLNTERESSIDVRCLMAGRFSVDHPVAPPGWVPFYVALQGKCTVTTASTASSVATDTPELPVRP